MRSMCSESIADQFHKKLKIENHERSKRAPNLLNTVLNIINLTLNLFFFLSLQFKFEF